MAVRLQAMERARGLSDGKYAEGFKVALHHAEVDRPLRWRQPRMVFVNSMGDLFHRSVPRSFIGDVFAVMNDASWHVFQVLTKRAGRLQQLASGLRWTGNVWMGVTVENRACKGRIAELCATPAARKFLSLEPLLEPLGELDLSGIDWVIVGGESGPGARHLQADWVRDIREQCLAASVPFFFKQWGGVNKKRSGRLLDGRIWDQMPLAIA